jgi:hypothetical protein
MNAVIPAAMARRLMASRPAMSAFGGKADISSRQSNVCF